MHARLTHLNLSGLALVSSISADLRSIRYTSIHDSPNFPQSVLRSGYALWTLPLARARARARSWHRFIPLSVSPGTVLGYRHYRNPWDKRHSTNECSPRRRDKSVSLRSWGFSWVLKLGSTCSHSSWSRGERERERTVLSAAIIRALFISIPIYPSRITLDGLGEMGTHRRRAR